MKPAIILALWALAAVPAAADESLRSDATIRSNTLGSCMAAGKERGADEARTRAFCECTWNVLADNLTREEFVTMDRTGVDGGDVRELPSFKRVEPKLRECKQKQDAATKPAQ